MLVQYIVLNTERMTGWTRGAVCAQACHAAVAALATFATCQDTVAYTSPDTISSMAKVILEVSTDIEFASVISSLTDLALDHYVWHELPENVPTALALRPYRKIDIGQTLSRLKLYK